jgi:hypothetical protein
MKKIAVVPIPTWFYAVLSRLPRWRETRLSGGSRVLPHAHDYLALYFTFRVEALCTSKGDRPLPESAMVIVPKRRVHGWKSLTGAASSLVGHYHPGHAAHSVAAG